MRRLGRYEMTARCLGRGATATVWEAVHDQTGERVAVKCFADDGVDLRRLEREITALQLLDLPGVVSLVERGVQENGAPWVATELVHGSPFPGVAATWIEVESVLRSLLETLARVHAVGIVHRDLKPSNVLVRGDGTVVVLDFGLARGSVLGATVTHTGEVVGTPLYLAPEQLLGDEVDARSDLYAVGVMLFEALVGKPPQPDTDFAGLWRSRLMRDAPPVATSRPDLPPEVCRLVDRLLDRSPANRPQTASEALALLGESDHHEFPWLGDDEVIRSVRAAAREGRRCTIGGGPGSGRTRALARAIQTLRSAGTAVWELGAASGPYRSLASHVSTNDARTAAEAEALIRVAVQEFLADGGVIALDDPSQVDVWTRRVVEGCDGSVIATGDRGDVQLASLEEQDLRALFWGPELIWRLPSDGAHELHRRTGGVPARVVAEVQSWVREGLAHWGPGPPDPLGLEPPPEGIRLHVDRMALDRLAAGLMPPRPTLTRREHIEPELEEHLEWTAFAGPDATASRVAQLLGRPAWQVELEREELARRGLVEEGTLGVRVHVAVPGFALWSSGERRAAHQRVAEALPPGSRLRLEHLASAEDWSRVVEEAELLTRRWARLGSNGLAVAGVVRAVRAIPEGLALDLTSLVALAARLAISLRDRATLRTVRTLVHRTRAPELDDLLRGALLVLDSQGAEARLLLDAIAFDDGETELCRQAQRVAAARFMDLEAEQTLVAELEPTVGRDPEPAVRAKSLTWCGLLRYREQRFEEAVDLHRQALKLRDDEAGRLSSMLNLAAALIPCHRLDEAEVWAGRALELASTLKHPGYESRAWFILRSCANHRGATSPSIEALRSLPRHDDLAMTEAMIALRGTQPTAEPLLQHVVTMGHPMLGAYAAALMNMGSYDHLPANQRSDVLLVRERELHPAGFLPTGRFVGVLLTNGLLPHEEDPPTQNMEQ